MTDRDGELPAEPEQTPPAPPAPSAGRRAGRAVREIVETLILAALIFFAVRMVVLNFRVDGESMVPNLHNAEMLLVNRNAYRSFDLGWLRGILPQQVGAATPDEFYPFDPPERGDIVVFDPPTRSDKPYIKRIIGLPGERITFNGGAVFINGTRLDEPYIQDEAICERRDVCDMVVPPGEVFVLGDNRNNSQDSRVFGSVGLDRIIGKAWLTYWPLPDFGFVPHYEYPGLPETPMTAPTGGVPGAVGAEQPRKERGNRRAVADPSLPALTARQATAAPGI